METRLDVRRFVPNRNASITTHTIRRSVEIDHHPQRLLRKRGEDLRDDRVQCFRRHVFTVTDTRDHVGKGSQKEIRRYTRRPRGHFASDFTEFRLAVLFDLSGIGQTRLLLAALNHVFAFGLRR